MNFNLFLIILIVLIIILCITLYNGLKILLTVKKEESIVKYELKLTMLKIAIFKRTGFKGKDNLADDENKDLEENPKEKNKEKDNKEEDKEKDTEEDETAEEKGLKERYEEFKPILKKLKKSKKELKKFLKDILKAIDLKKLEGNLIIGLNNHTNTIKIASWIWSIGAIVNTTSKPTLLTVDPKFREEILDFEGKVELKINLLKLIYYSLILLTKKNIRELIKELIDIGK